MAALSAIFVLGVLGARAVFKPFRTPSGAMAPALNPGDIFLSNKLAYSRAAPKRGDIVTFSHEDTILAKRLIGLPGDRVRMVNGQLELNGDLIPLTCRQAQVQLAFGSAKRCSERLTSEVTYDTFDRLSDGRFDTTLPGTVPPGNAFVLGDDRDNSRDSRAPEFGYIPLENINGRVDFVFSWPAR
jgi:signal peptidase I